MRVGPSYGVSALIRRDTRDSSLSPPGEDIVKMQLSAGQ